MKISPQLMKMITGFFCMFLFLTPFTVLAKTKVVVIPLYGDDPKPLKNIITVAKANGDFKDPVAAVNSITDASASNPYQVVIGPGVYTITQALQMKEYVDILGSGENVTKIRGAIGSDEYGASSAIISGANSSVLSSLNVENIGGGGVGIAIALYNHNASPRVTNVSATASGGAANHGVHNYFSSPTMTGVTAKASGGPNNVGIYNYSSSPTMANVSAAASGGPGSNWGIYNIVSSSPMMINITATASGGTYNYGVHNVASSSPTMTNVAATASGGTYNYGVYNLQSSSPMMTNGTATALGGENNSGLYNLNSSSPTLTNVTATAEGGSIGNHGIQNGEGSSPMMMCVIARGKGDKAVPSYGIYNISSSSSSPTIKQGTIEGSTASLATYDMSTVTVSQSTLIGGVSGTGTRTCVACDNGSGAVLGKDCAIIP